MHMPLFMTPRSFLDPQYGLIHITDEEMKVVDHPLFQRLRGIKQNGLLHLVFPADTHNRFEHSLGTLHVADSILHSLIHNSEVAAKKHQGKGVLVKDRVGPGQALDFSSLPEEILKRVFRLTRLAALAHDLGHGPLSHTFDKFAPKLSDIKPLLSDSNLDSLTSLRESLSCNGKGHKDGLDARVSHEVMSCILFAFIWKGIGEEDVPRAVAAVLLGENDSPELGEDRPWIPLLHDIVSSAPADADRMDYLERDSRSCGVNYGLFDRNRLLKTFLCYRAADPEREQYRLGLKSSGFRAIENFIQARFELFVQIYYHKTNRALELMLKEIARIAEASSLTLVDTTSLKSLVAGYTELSDERFLDALRGRPSSFSFKTQPSIAEIAEALTARKLWRRVIDFQEHEIDSKLKDDLFSDLSEHFPQEPLCVDQPATGATKDLDGGAVRLTRGSDDIYTVAACPRGNWSDISHIIKTLDEAEEKLTRIYVKLDNSSLARKVRARALEFKGSLVAEKTDEERNRS